MWRQWWIKTHKRWSWLGIYGEDIDVTRTEEAEMLENSTKDDKVEEEKSLEDEIGERWYLSDLA